MSSSTKDPITLTEKEAEAILREAVRSSISGDEYRRTIAVIMNFEFDGLKEDFSLVSNDMQELLKDGYKFDVHRIIIPTNRTDPNLTLDARNRRALAHIHDVLEALAPELDGPETLLIINHRTHGGWKKDDEGLYLCSGKYEEPNKRFKKGNNFAFTSVAFREIMKCFKDARSRIVCLADSCSAERVETEVPCIMLAACGKEDVTKSDTQGFGPNLVTLLRSALEEERWVSLGTLYSDLAALVAGNEVLSAPKWRPGRQVTGTAPDIVIKPVIKPTEVTLPKQSALARQRANLELRQNRKQTGSTVWIAIHVNPVTEHTAESLENGLRSFRLLPDIVDIEVNIGQGFVKDKAFQGNSSAWFMVCLDNMVYVHLPKHPAINYCFGPCPPILFTARPAVFTTQDIAEFVL